MSSNGLIAEGRHEVAEDRRVAAAMRQQHNRAALNKRADVTEALAGALEAAEATLERVREAVSRHPKCDVHPDRDPITCGWKQAVADGRAVELVDAAETSPVAETTEGME